MSVVSSFGYLYLSSIDHDSTDDTVQVITAHEGGSAGTAKDTSGFQQNVGKPFNFEATAETPIADATTAGANGVQRVEDKSKDRTPFQTTTVETAAVATITGEPLVTETTAGGRVTQPMSGFERHNTSLPAPAYGTAAMRGAGQQPWAPQPIFWPDVTSYWGIPSPRHPVFDHQQEAMAQYRTRMRLEREAMRRAADWRAREYWGGVQAPVPPGVAYPSQVPAHGIPAYGQGHAPGPYGYPW